MFKGEQEYRTLRQNVALAGSLALVAGMVNTLGFLQLEVFTSHVTGDVGQISVAIALHQAEGLWPLAARVVAFFSGAFTACIAIEGAPWRNKPYVYSALLLLEAALLGSVVLGLQSLALGRLALCIAMGLQNGLVTRLSGAVVRTTHLTGVVTDLGIEAARVVLLLVSRVATWAQWRAYPDVMTGRTSVNPSSAKTVLLLTILGGFFVGGASAGGLFVCVGVGALGAPMLLLLIGGALAFRNGMESLGPANRQ